MRKLNDDDDDDSCGENAWSWFDFLNTFWSVLKCPHNLHETERKPKQNSFKTGSKLF